MQFERIRVATRDHYRGSQEPQAFWWRERHYPLIEIMDRWYEGRLDAQRVPMRYFRVKTASGEVFILRYHELFCAWSLLVPGRCGDGACSSPFGHEEHDAPAPGT